MEKKIIILKNSGALGISTIMGKLFYFLLFMCIGRFLGPEELGKFAFAISFITLFSAINELGLNILSVREVSQNKELAPKFLSNLVMIKMTLGVLTLLFVVIGAKLLKYPEEMVKLVFLLGISTLFVVVSQGMRWYFQAIQRLEYESVISISQNLLYFLLGYIALKYRFGIEGIAYTQIIVGIFIILLTWMVIRSKLGVFHLEFDFAFWRKLLKNSIPFALMLVFTGIYLNSDTVLLSLFKGDKAVGFYNAANKLIIAAKMLPVVIIPAIFPVMAETVDLSRFKRLIEKAIHYILALALPLGIMVSLLGEKIIVAIYGEEFLASALPLRILIWSAVCIFFSSVFGYALIAKGYQKINTTLVGLGVLVSLGLNLLLIPKLSYIGTSLSILCTEFFVLLGGYLLVYTKLGISLSSLIKYFGEIAFCTFLMGVGIYVMQLWNFGLLAIMFLGGVIYLFSLLRLDKTLAQDWIDFKRSLKISSSVQKRVLSFAGSLLKGVKR